MDQDQHEDRGDQPGGSRRTRVIVIVGVVLVILGVGIAATVMTISANQQRAQEETLTAIAQAGQATNTAQVAEAQTRQADSASSAASSNETAIAAGAQSGDATQQARSVQADTQATQEAERIAATQSIYAAYEARIAEIQATTPIYGPANGSLLLQDFPNYVADYSGVTVKDFLVSAVIENPFSAFDAEYSYGFVFRHIGYNENVRLVLNSESDWYVMRHTENRFTTLASGSTTHLKSIGVAKNTLVLFVEGNTGVFYINDWYGGTFELDGWDQPGNIMIGTQLLIREGFFEPGTTDYTDFTIWRLP